MSPVASIIVIFDRGELEPCLSSLLAQEGVDLEIIAVVGDEEQAAHLPGSPLLRPLVVEDRNPAFRRNLAATRAKGEYLAFIDDDAHAPPGWLVRGVSYLERNGIFAGVGGPNLIPPGSPFLERLTDMLLCSRLIGGGSRAYRGGGSLLEARIGEVHLVNFIARRDWFDRVGGLNEALGYGGEDSEYIFMAKKLGARFTFDPGLMVFHKRRPFGPAYFAQRFNLRKQSAKLFVVHPRMYAGNAGFLLALAAPLPAVALAAHIGARLGTAGIVGLAAACLVPLLGLAALETLRRGDGPDGEVSLAGRLTAGAVLVPAYAVHVAVNLAGLWWGLLGALIAGPRKLRRRLKRSLETCGL